MNRHLMENEIQKYMDGTLPVVDQEQIEKHLTGCEQCREEIRAYRQLFTELNEMPEFKLPEDFSQQVMNGIRQAAGSAERGALQEIVFSIVGLLIGIGATIYYTGVQPFLSLASGFSTPELSFFGQLLMQIRSSLEKIHIDFFTFGAAGIIILLITFADRLLLRQRMNLS